MEVIAQNTNGTFCTQITLKYVPSVDQESLGEDSVVPAGSLHQGRQSLLVSYKGEGRGGGVNQINHTHQAIM